MWNHHKCIIVFFTQKESSVCTRNSFQYDMKYFYVTFDGDLSKNFTIDQPQDRQIDIEKLKSTTIV